MLEATIRRAVIAHHRRSGRVLFSDTTLRDGEQMPGATLEPAEKLEIAHALAAAGIHSLDAGFPAASRADADAVAKIAAEVRGPVVTALCRTLPADIDAAHDCLKSLPKHRRGVSLFLGTSPTHRADKLRRPKDDLLKIIAGAVRYASRKFAIVSFACEDATRTELDFLCACYTAAIDAGATTIGVPDTVGLLTPESTTTLFEAVQAGVPNRKRALLAAHMHNDLGLATANSLAAITAGANVVQGTVGGVGERAGNAAIEEIALALELHSKQYRRSHTVKLPKLKSLGELVSARMGLAPAPMKPVFGRNVFATAAGIHQDGILKNPETYLPYPPPVVGGPERVELVLGRHSGKGAVTDRLRSLDLPVDDDTVDTVLGHIKASPKSAVFDDTWVREAATS
ncbi:MAG: pyruvate carboxyltransferase [Planctomycetota bacterium]